ncbi:MAG TPA: hypothetical protein VGH72_05655 [Pseudonocardia sp.]
MRHAGVRQQGDVPLSQFQAIAEQSGGNRERIRVVVRNCLVGARRRAGLSGRTGLRVGVRGTAGLGGPVA